MRPSRSGAVVLACALVLAGVPVQAQEDTPAATTGPPAGEEATQAPSVPESGRPDLRLEMPAYLGDFVPDIVMTRGEEHLVNLGADDARRVEIEDLLEAVGAEIEDMVSGYALVSQEGFFSLVVAIRIDGITPGTLLPAYLPSLIEDLDDPQAITVNKGGKDVIVIASIGNEDEYVELFVYDAGDTLWMLQGPGDVVDTTLAGLPDPLPVE